MLTLDQCRKIEPGLQGLSDEELIEVRANLYRAAQLALEAWAKQHSGSKNPEWLLSNKVEGIR